MRSPKPAAYLSVCAVSGGAALGLVGLIEWDCAEHSKVTIVVFPTP